MYRARFRRLVQKALAGIPPEFASRMENVDVQVSARPTPQERADSGIGPHDLLLGLYVGYNTTNPVSLLESGVRLPDRIMIYQDAIESVCRNEDEVVNQVRVTVLHEVAHHFGIDDERLHEIGAY